MVGAKAELGVPPGKAQMKKHVWAVCLGVAAVLTGAAALATGTGEAESPAEEPDNAVVLGEEDLADRAEILRNMYRRITPPDIPLVQDVGTWPAAWEEFGENWNTAAADREYGAWVVPVEVSQDAGLTVVKDGAGTVLWRGWTDFARPESADVVLTGGLVAEEDWAAYEGVRDAVAALRDTAGRTPAPPMRTTPTNGLRFTAHEWTTNGTFRLELAYEIDTNVDIFAYAVAHTSAWVVATWTNDENQVVTDTNLVWTSVGLPFNGMESDWEQRGTVAISNGVAEFEDSGFSATLGRERFYAAAVAEDTDGDGLNDGWEDFVSHTDPGNQDSDGDGVPDGMDTMPATSNVWFEVIHSKTNYFLQELGVCDYNAPEVPFNDWSWVVSDQPPTSDSVLQDVRVSGYADDYITVDSHPINHTRGPYTYNNWHVINQTNDLGALQFTMRLVDWPDANYAGSNVVCVGLSDAEPFEVEWEWKVPMALTGPECLCVGDSAQFEAAGAGGGPYTWSVTYEGTAPVAEIDTDGVFTALAPGLATVIASVGDVYAVSQAVNVVQIEFLAGGGNVAATELKIAKWNNAFWSTVSTVTNTVLTNGVIQTNIYMVTNFFVKDNFIDLDPDRFCVRITDPSHMGAENVSILLNTTGPYPIAKDGATAIDLYETSVNSGIFVSTNMILVSDDVDDAFSNSLVPGDNTRNDRTHKIAPEGKVIVTYPDTGQTSGVKEISVNKFGTIHVIPVIMRGTPNGNPLTTALHVEAILEHARGRFGQIGIDLTWEAPEIRNPPDGLILAQMFVERDSVPATVLSSDAKSLISEVATVGNTNDIHIIFVRNMLAGSDELIGTSISSFRYAPSEAGYFFNVFIDTLDVGNTEYGGYIVAHELGHLLTNEGHVADDKWRLMFTFTETNGAAGSRRLSDSEETKIRGDSHVDKK